MSQTLLGVGRYRTLLLSFLLLSASKNGRSMMNN